MSIEKLIDPRKNLFIEASAGTGKTYTIQQMVAQLVNENCPLKKILIVTYTEKAAGELKDRIRKKLEEVLDDDFTDSVTAEKFEKALRDVDNAAIFTIHSFCQKALKEFAYDAGRPFDLTMVDDESVTDLIHQWARDKWPQDTLYQKLLDISLSASALENELTAKLASAINLYKGSQNGKELITLDSAEPCVFDEPPQTFQELQKIEGFKEALDTLKKNSSLGFTKKGDKTIADFIKSMEVWEPSKKLYDGSAFKSSATVKAWPEDVLAAFDFFYGLKDSVSELPKQILQAKIQEFLYSQIVPLFDTWQSYKNEQKLQSFNDMILAVHTAVLSKNTNSESGKKAEGSGLCQKLRAQYNYAIIDEFQDTNQLQWDIFREIFLKDKDHSIFVVGDPKQSIYSFQGADVNVYHKATAEIGNGRNLDHNYRSTNSIIEACNKLFACEDFFGGSLKFSDSYAPGAKEGDDAKQKKAQKPGAKYFNGDGWVEIPAFWVSEKGINAATYAQTCVEKIIDCCTYVTHDGKNKTRLQIFNKNFGKAPNEEEYRSVTFKDFAILARARSEMENIEDAMKHAGVPFTRYKDSNLFYGRECAEWVALFKAIDATDFSAWNRRILNEVLITDFFGVSLADIESEYFDDPLSEQRLMISGWKELATKHRFAELQERIYNDSGIEKRLTDLSRLQELTKLRQIGNYSINYLYNHNCALEDLIRHLQGLSKFEGDVDEQDSNLVAKGTDFDAVQVMTIHASKGLEFPVVISVAGFKQLNKNTKGPYLYHAGEEIRLGYGKTAKEAREKEEMEEWSRLFYVNFTRPSSVMMLPRYAEWYDENGNAKPSFKFLANSMENFCSAQNAHLFQAMEPVKEWNISWEKMLKQKVQEGILLPFQAMHKADSIEEPADAEEAQKEAMAALQKSIGKISIKQHSYSSLAGKVDSNVSIEGDEHLDKEGVSETNNYAGAAFESTVDNESSRKEAEIKYPRGSKIGNALHELFELTKFHVFGQKHPDESSLFGDAELVNTVEDVFKKQSLPIWNHKDDWTKHTLGILWNTLNASLPAIEGGKLTAETFKLTSIEEANRKAEAQFNLNATTDDNGEASEYLQSICKGFIDLMFMRKDSSGNIRFSILDWKSDVMGDGDYSSESIKEKVDEDYSVQRVLYSYCLIKWLKQFYAGVGEGALTESEIYDKYFGGIYYVFVRGCRAGQSSGIYAHTWKNFGDLCKSYEMVKTLMHKRKASEAQE